MNPSIVSYGLLVFELCPGQTLGQSTLPVTDAAELGALMATDLKPWLGKHIDLDLSLAAAAFDPVEVLRAGWPVHAEMARLTQLAPKSHEPRLLCLGHHQGQMPEGLQPNPAYVNGPLRWLPFVLSGHAEAIAEIQAYWEAELLERGMAGAATALTVQRAFGAEIEHARYMTLNDGVAMMAMQYGHMGLEPIWPLIEHALYAADTAFYLDAAPEPLIYLNQGIAHIALLDCHQWARLQTGLEGKNAEQIEVRYQQFQMRQRQIAALLEAHGMSVEFDFCADAAHAKDTLQRV